MSYYARFVFSGDAVTWEELELALQQEDHRYRIDGDDLLLGEVPCGQLDLTESGDEIFEEEIEMLKDAASQKASAEQLLTLLTAANCMLTVQVLWQGRSDEETFGALDPLWGWLFVNRRDGLLSFEMDVFYTTSGKIE